jgi:integrase
MPAKSLTDAFVRTVKLPKKEAKPNQIVYMDRIERGLSLALVVSHGGTKTFRAVTYENGKPTSTKLGQYPGMTVKQAREAARKLWADPEKFAAETAKDTVKEIGDDWLKRDIDARGVLSAKEVRRHLEVYVYPRVGDRKFVDLRRGLINKVLDEIAEENGQAMSGCILGTLRMLTNWYQKNHEHYVSPIVRGMRKGTRTVRDRILNDAEVRALWKACDKVLPQYAVAVKLGLLTGQRREKIADLKRSDVVDGVWSVRRQDQRQKGTPTKLKLPQAALDVLEALDEIEGNPYYLATTRREKLHSWSQRKDEIDALMPEGTPPWVFHDLRRTARSLMSRARVRPDIAEMVLGHRQRGIILVYDHWHYEPEIAQALESLATLIGNILNPPADNVIPIRA